VQFNGKLRVTEVDGLIFQQDGAPAHFGAIVHTALAKRFPGGWIGRIGRLIGPPRTPYLTPRDFFFWGYIRDIMHSQRVDSLPDLGRRITAALAAVPVDVLSRVWGEVEFRFNVCRAISNAYIELH
jgi:hypothetical protein